jgi:hypothetical protein
MMQIQPQSENKPVVGAIRWNGWFKGNPWQKNLNPQKWHYRLPFYGVENSENEVLCEGDTQEVMDQEIRYAQEMGLGYWAFLHSHSPTQPWREMEYNYALKNYLSSSIKTQVGFCMIISPTLNWVGLVKEVVGFIQEASYQKVLDGRPLIYLLFWDSYGRPENTWGDLTKTREKIDYLRQAVVASGKPDPYLVTLSMETDEAVRYVDECGLDALSNYACWTNGAFQDLAAVNRARWEEFQATGHKMVAQVNAGWDPRPRYEGYYGEVYPTRDWVTNPTPEELAEHLGSAVDWTRANPEAAEAQVILVYAWNETDEGGWLMPTLAEGTARVEAIGRRMRDKG